MSIAISTTTKWTTSGRQILCSINGGIATPFMTKGVSYSPTPIGGTSIPDPLGSENSAIWQRDISQLRAMGANSIRIYGMDASNRRNCNDALDACWNNGVDPIYVMLSIWVTSTSTNINNLSHLREQYQCIGEDYGNHPAVIGFSIGSEYNTPTNIASSNFWTQFQSLVTAVKKGITISGGTKLISTGFVDLVENNQESTIVQGEANDVGVDVWGIDVYRGSTFSNLWSQVESATTKPFVITEFGAPASYHPNNQPCEAAELPAIGTHKMGNLVIYMASLWNEIENNSAVTNAINISSGGYIFEWSDEWWKASQCGGTDVHSGGTAPNGAFPGGWDDEEWFGLNSIAAGTPNVLTPRATYNHFQSIWKSAPAPQNGLPGTAVTVTLTNSITTPALGRNIKFNYTSDVDSASPTWHEAVEIEALGTSKSFTFPAGTNGISMVYEVDSSWMQGCQLKGTALENIKDGDTIQGNWISPNGNGSCPVG